MNGEKIAIRAILLYRCGIKDLRQVQQQIGINDMESPGTINQCVAQTWLKHFKESDTSLVDKPRSERFPLLKDVVMLEMIKWQSNINASMSLTRVFHNESILSQNSALWTNAVGTCSQRTSQRLGSTASEYLQTVAGNASRYPFLVLNCNWRYKMNLFSS